METLKTHLKRILRENSKIKKWDVPKDYFNWGRDPRHIIDNTEKIPSISFSGRNVSLKRFIVFVFKKISLESFVVTIFKKRCSFFEETYQLMSNADAKRLFAELVLMKMINEEKMR